MRINGRALTGKDIAQVSARTGRAPTPGDYWYDGTTGFYGMAGHGTSGRTAAHLPVPPVQRSASKGTSGVLVNGRELTKTEAKWLIATVGGNASNPAAYQGIYTLDSAGNLVRSDGHFVANLFKSPRAKGGGAAGGGAAASGAPAPATASSQGSTACSWAHFDGATGSLDANASAGCD